MYKSRIQEVREAKQAEYDKILNLGADNGLRINLQWMDAERTVHSWEAVAKLAKKKSTTLRVYSSRHQLENMELMHPEYPHGLAPCAVTVAQQARRGPPQSPEAVVKAEALRVKQIAVTLARIKALSAELDKAQAKLRYLNV
jgi:hypothetical protein